MKYITKAKTSNYDKFELMVGNRDYKESHACNIAQSIKENNMMDVFPIICEKNKAGKLEVIDGQHRLAACKKIGIPVTYCLVEGITHKDMARINCNVKAWGTKDYLQHFCSLGKKEYVKLSGFIERTGFPVAVAVDLLSSGIHEGGGIGTRVAFRAGSYKVTNQEHGEIVYSVISKMKKSGCRFASDRSLVKAISNIITHVDCFDPSKFIAKFSYQELKKRANWKDYIFEIDEIYNYRVLAINRISIAGRLKELGLI